MRPEANTDREPSVPPHLTDETWAHIEDLVADVKLTPGGKAFGRQLLNIIFCILKTEGTACNPHPVFGDPKTIRNLINKLIYYRAWDAIVARLRERDPEVLEDISERRLELIRIRRRDHPPEVWENIDNLPPAEKRKRTADLRKYTTPSYSTGTRKRIGAVILRLEGYKNEDIATTMKISLSYVNQTVRRYRQFGVERLLAPVRDDDCSRFLTNVQMKELTKIARSDRDPFEPNLRTSIKSLLRWCKLEYKVECSATSLLFWLKQHGVQLEYMRDAGLAKGKIDSKRRRAASLKSASKVRRAA